MPWQFIQINHYLQISSIALLRLSYSFNASQHFLVPLPQIFFAVLSMFSPWILGSGASYHMTSDSTILSAITPLPSHSLLLHTVDVHS